MAGERADLEWVVDRFTPVLLAQARVRLGPRLQELNDPLDLVQDVWAVALPKLPGLIHREVLRADQLLAFLARILLYRVNNLVHRHVKGKPLVQRDATGTGRAIDRLPASQSGVLTAAVRHERGAAVTDALAALPPGDRDIVVMRGLERSPVKEIAVALGISENHVSVRYRRALQTLRDALPNSVFEDLVPA